MPHSEVCSIEVLSKRSTQPVPPAGASTARRSGENQRSSKPMLPFGVSRNVFTRPATEFSAPAADCGGGRESPPWPWQPTEIAQAASKNVRHRLSAHTLRSALNVHFDLTSTRLRDHHVKDRRAIMDRQLDGIDLPWLLRERFSDHGRERHLRTLNERQVIRGARDVLHVREHLFLRLPRRLRRIAAEL